MLLFFFKIKKSMRVVLLIVLFLIIENVFGQTMIKGCTTQQFVADVVVYDTQNNTILGVSDKHGAVEVDSHIVDLTLVHPDYGNIKTLKQEVICIDQLLLKCNLMLKRNC